MAQGQVLGVRGGGRSEAPLPESLRQRSALLPSCPEVPRGPSEGPGPTSHSPPGQALASLCPACGEGTALSSLLFAFQHFPGPGSQDRAAPESPPWGPSLLPWVWPPDLSRCFWPCHPLSSQSLSILCLPPMALLRDMYITAHGGPWVTGRCPQLPICASPEPRLTVGVTNGGLSDTMTGRGMGHSGDRKLQANRLEEGQPWGPAQTCRSLSWLLAQTALRKRTRGDRGRWDLLPWCVADTGGRWSYRPLGTSPPGAGAGGAQVRAAGLARHPSCHPLSGSWRGSWPPSPGGPWEGLPSLCPGRGQARPGSCGQSLSCKKGPRPRCLPHP